MRNVLVHACLAFAGVVAGLPVAAAVQWNREPPAEMWSLIGEDLVAALDSDPGFDAYFRFATGPGGPRITSVTNQCIRFWSRGSGILGVSQAEQGPRALRWAVLTRGGNEARFDVREVRPPVTTEDGVTWHRVRVTGVTWHRVRRSDDP